MIDPLSRNDRRCLDAAQGWVALGSAGEALEELRGISSVHQEAEEVMETYWAAYAGLGEWESAFAVAEKLVQSVPGSSFGWVHRAYALRRMGGGGIEKAWDALLPAAVRFPREPIIPYNLSCYCALMSRLDEAREWMDRAMAIGHSKAIKTLALEDPDLERLVAAGYFE